MRKQINESFLRVQSSLKIFHKSKKGYGYNYTPLDAILEVLNPLLNDNGLFITQTQQITDKMVIVETTITEVITGEVIKSSVSSMLANLKNMNEYQSIGSAITYLRRYGVSLMFGITSDEDTDAADKRNGEGSEPKKEKKQPPKKDNEEDILTALKKGLVKNLAVNNFNMEFAIDYLKRCKLNKEEIVELDKELNIYQESGELGKHLKDMNDFANMDNLSMLKEVK